MRKRRTSRSHSIQVKGPKRFKAKQMKAKVVRKYKIPKYWTDDMAS